MKKLNFIFPVIALFLFNCEDVNKLTKFNLEYNTSTSIPSDINLSLPIEIFTPDVATNTESEFAVNDTRKDLIQEIKLTQLKLTITNPQNQGFDFLKTINIYIQAEGLSELEIASMENIPDQIGNILDMEVADKDLKEYLKKDKFTLKVKTVTDKLITEDVDIDIFSKFRVDAKILGI